MGVFYAGSVIDTKAKPRLMLEAFTAISLVVTPLFKGAARKRRSEMTTEDIRASSDVEAPLLSIVRELLNNPAIEPEDDFFLSGGYSLLGTRLVLRARKTFGVKIAVHDLFDAGTVARLAVRIEEMMMAEIDAMPGDDAAYAAQADGA